MKIKIVSIIIMFLMFFSFNISIVFSDCEEVILWEYSCDTLNGVKTSGDVRLGLSSINNIEGQACFLIVFDGAGSIQFNVTSDIYFTKNPPVYSTYILNWWFKSANLYPIVFDVKYLYGNPDIYIMKKGLSDERVKVVYGDLTFTYNEEPVGSMENNEWLQFHYQTIGSSPNGYLGIVKVGVNEKYYSHSIGGSTYHLSGIQHQFNISSSVGGRVLYFDWFTITASFCYEEYNDDSWWWLQWLIALIIFLIIVSFSVYIKVNKK